MDHFLKILWWNALWFWFLLQPVQALFRGICHELNHISKDIAIEINNILNFNTITDLNNILTKRTFLNRTNIYLKVFLLHLIKLFHFPHIRDHCFKIIFLIFFIILILCSLFISNPYFIFECYTIKPWTRFL